MKDWFKFRMGWGAAVLSLPDEEAGRLFKAVLAFAATGEAPALSGAGRTVFAMISETIRAERERDAEISAKRSAAGAKGAAKTNFGKSRQKAANAGTGRQKPANDGGYEEKTANDSNCRQMPTDTPEGLRIQALDSAPAGPAETDGADTYTDSTNNNNIHPYSNCSNRDMSSEEEVNRKRTGALRFTVPSAEEVAAYCRERGNSVDAQRFVDFYTAKGWRIGKEPMKDWKACVRTWERNEKDRARDSGTDHGREKKWTVAAQRYTQRDYSGEDEEAFARMIAGF